MLNRWWSPWQRPERKWSPITDNISSDTFSGFYSPRFPPVCFIHSLFRPPLLATLSPAIKEKIRITKRNPDSVCSRKMWIGAHSSVRSGKFASPSTWNNFGNSEKIQPTVAIFQLKIASQLPGDCHWKDPVRILANFDRTSSDQSNDWRWSVSVESKQ